jgi:hypothetical protein
MGVMADSPMTEERRRHLARARILLAAPPSKARGEALADLYDEIQASKADRG